MNGKKEFDSDIDFTTLGHYVEGDYINSDTEEPEFGYRYISPVNKNGFKLEIVDYSIEIIGPNKSKRIFTFDTKEDWEDFCGAIWKTEHYVAVRKKDFIEFFQALRYVHGHHCRQIDVAVSRQESIQKEIDKQQECLDKLKTILGHYEDKYTEVYSENKL